MSLAQKVSLNTFFQITGRIITVATAFLIVILLTRHLGVEGYGQYTTIIAFLNFFAVIADLGLHLIAAREMAQIKSEEQKAKIFNNALGLRIISATSLMLISIGIAFLMPYDQIVKIGIAIFAIGMFFYLLSQVANTIFQVKLKAKWIAVSEIIGRVLNLILVIYIINQGAGLLAIMLAASLGFILTFVLNVIFGSKYLRFIPRFDKKILKKLWQESWPIGLIIILITLFFRMDAVLISIIGTDNVVFEAARGIVKSKAVGIYGPPYRIIDALYLFPGILLGIFFPVFSKFAATNIKRSKVMLQKVIDILLIIVVPMTLGLFVFAPQIIEIIGGKEFTESIRVLQILGFSIGLFFISNVFYYIMIGVRKQKKLILPYFIAFIINLGLHIVMISFFSYLGAAITSVLTQIFVLIIGIYLTKKHFHFSPSFKKIIPILISGIIAFGLPYFGIILKIIPEIDHLSLLTQFIFLSTTVTVVGIIYIFLLYSLGGVSKTFIQSLIKRKAT